MGNRKSTEKQWPTHYTENKRLNSMNPTKNPGSAHMLLMGKQFMF